MKEYKTHITNKFTEDWVEYFSVVVEVDWSKYWGKLPLKEYHFWWMRMLLWWCQARLKLFKNPVLIWDWIYKSEWLYTNEENEERYKRWEIRWYIKQ